MAHDAVVERSYASGSNLHTQMTRPSAADLDKELKYPSIEHAVRLTLRLAEVLRERTSHPLCRSPFLFVRS
jgi:hypothetical protein